MNGSAAAAADLAVSLPVPSRDEILRSPVNEGAPQHGATSSLTAAHIGEGPYSPVIDEPSEALERELAVADSDG